MESTSTDNGKKNRRPFKTFLQNTTALAAGAGVFFGAPILADVTDSHTLPPLEDCPSYSAPLVDGPAATSAQMPTDNASRESLIIQSILIRAGDPQKMGLIEEHLRLPVNVTPAAGGEAYGESCGIRVPLGDIAIFDPARHDRETIATERDNPDNYLHFQAIASFHDKESDSIALAFFEPQSGTLSIQTVGLTPDEGHDRVVAVLSQNDERAVPMDFARGFLAEVRDQVRGQGLDVRRTEVFSHSMGAQAGVAIKGLLETSAANRLVFGNDPGLTIIEGFGESYAAGVVAESLDISRERLTRNTVTVRSGQQGEANIVAAESDLNQPIGQQVYSLSTHGVDTHALPDIAIGLLNGNRQVSSFDGVFTASGTTSVQVDLGSFLGKAIQAGREARQAIGLG